MKRFLLAAALVAFALPANADTLYVAGPPPAAPGHPIHLGADHKAGQVGDLIGVLFNFSVSNQSTDLTATKKDYNIALGAGQGNLAQSLLRFPSGLGGGTNSDTLRSRAQTNSFSSAMMALVTNVLPSGALAIEGDQDVIINGQHQTLHVRGLVRPEDIDNTDTVLSTRIANVQATFAGDFQEKNKGVLKRVLDFLF